MRQMKVPLKKMQIPKGSRSHRCYGKKLVSLLRSIGLTAAPPPPPPTSSRWGSSPPCPSCAFGLASSRDSCGSGSALQGSAWGPGGLSSEHRPQLGVPPASHGSPAGQGG